LLVGEEVVVLLTKSTVVTSTLLAYAGVVLAALDDLCGDVGVVVEEFQIIIQTLPDRRYFRFQSWGYDSVFICYQ